MQQTNELTKQSYRLSKEAVKIAKQGRFIEAIQVNLKCLEIKKQIKDREGIAFCYDRLSGIYWRLHRQSKDDKEKLELAGRSYSFAKDSLSYGNATSSRIINLIRMSEVYAQQFLSMERLDDAARFFIKSLSYNVTLQGIVHVRSYIFSSLRMMYINAKKAWILNQESGSPDKMALFYQKAYEYGCNAKKYINQGEERDQLVLLSKITHDYAKCLENIGQIERAIQVLENNLLLNKEIDYKEAEILTLDKIASICFRKGELLRAKVILEKIINDKQINEIVVYDHSRHILAEIYNRLGEEAARQADWDEAKHAYEKSLELSKLNNDERKTAEAEIRLAFFNIKIQDYKQAYSLFKNGFDSFIAFVSKREAINFVEKLGQSAQEKLQEADKWAKENDLQRAALCYASVWDELAEKSKSVQKRESDINERQKNVKQKAHVLINTMRMRIENQQPEPVCSIRQSASLNEVL